MKDITDKNDIIRLVDTFYDRVRADGLLEPVFRHLDWPKHLPTMYNFWSSIMFGDMSYQGSPFQKHLNLRIDATHFQRWLEIFEDTVDDLFEGPKSEEIKTRAQSIAGIFQHKLGLI